MRGEKLGRNIRIKISLLILFPIIRYGWHSKNTSSEHERGRIDKEGLDCIIALLSDIFCI